MLRDIELIFLFCNLTAKDLRLISHKLWVKCWNKITNDNVCMHIPSLTPRYKPIIKLYREGHI